MKKLIIVLVVLICLPAYAQTGSEYATPDSWRMHYNTNGAKASMDGIDINGGTLTLGVTARNVTRLFEDTNDNDLHVYLRGKLYGVSLGDGEVQVNFNMRGATDTSGRVRNKSYYILYDSLDSSRGDDSWDYRLYHANIVLDNVISYTRLSAGRLYLDHLSDLQLDGGDLRIGTDSYNAFVYYGLPVTYYMSHLDTQMLGGGGEANPTANLRLRGEVIKFFDDSDMDADTLYFKLRGDLAYKLGVLDGSVYGEGGMLGEAWHYGAGTHGTISSTGTVYNLWVKGQYERNDETVNLAISDFDLVNGYQSQYIQAGLNLWQGLAKHFAVGAGFETRYNYDQFYGDRDYYRGMVNFDIIDILPNNYISLTADYWYVPEDSGYKENKKLYFGGRLSQIFTDKFEGWLGASLTNYRYYYKQYDKLPSNYTGTNKKLDNSVYLLYAGLSFKPMENMVVQLDYTYEDSQVIKDFDSDSDRISTVSAMLNYNF